MAGAKDFWVPSELALEILGFNKNILEKRISAGYIKKETKSGVELVEISGEIDRFGLSEEVAREKLKDYIDKDHGETVGSITHPELFDVKEQNNEVVKEEQVPSEPEVSHTIPETEKIDSSSKSVSAPDYSPFFNQIAETLFDIKKTAMAIPEIVGAQIQTVTKNAAPSSNKKEFEEFLPRFDAIFQEFSRLAPIEQKNAEYQKEINTLRTKLEQSNAEVVKMTTTCNQVMDELEQSQKKHSAEIENLRNLIKTEISDLGSINVKAGGGGSKMATLFSFLVLLGVGFLIFEFFKPTYTVLKSQNDKINPLTASDIQKIVEKEVSILDQKQKLLLDSNSEILKNGQLAVQKDINSTFSSLFDQQKDVNSKLLNGILSKQNELKEKLSSEYMEKMKTIEKEIVDLRAEIKSTLETAIMIKPGSMKVIKDSAE